MNELNEGDWAIIGSKFVSLEHDIEEILQRLKQLEENQEQIIEILWDELKIQVRFVKSEEL